jgi:hypothetical protein
MNQDIRWIQRLDNYQRALKIDRVGRRLYLAT